MGKEDGVVWEGEAPGGHLALKTRWWKVDKELAGMYDLEDSQV
jgi:hypothetical protein